MAETLSKQFKDKKGYYDNSYSKIDNIKENNQKKAEKLALINQDII